MWRIHDSLRCSLLGAEDVMNGPIWSTNPPMARTLAASMPSGAPQLVNLRRSLRMIIGYEEPEPVMLSMDFCIMDIRVVERPWPLDAIYVGHGPPGSGLNPSPWGSPFVNSNRC